MRSIESPWRTGEVEKGMFQVTVWNMNKPYIRLRRSEFNCQTHVPPHQLVLGSILFLNMEVPLFSYGLIAIIRK